MGARLGTGLETWYDALRRRPIAWRRTAHEKNLACYLSRNCGCAVARFGRRARLGEAGAHLSIHAAVHQSLYGCDGLGRSLRTEFPKTRLRILGWRADFPCASAGHRARGLDLAQRFRSERSR